MLSDQNVVCISHLSHVYYISHPYHPPCFLSCFLLLKDVTPTMKQKLTKNLSPTTYVPCGNGLLCILKLCLKLWMG
jgi:hypothetical protein